MGGFHLGADHGTGLNNDDAHHGTGYETAQILAVMELGMCLHKYESQSQPMISIRTKYIRISAKNLHVLLEIVLNCIE